MEKINIENRFPGYRIEDRSIALTAIPGWVWVMMIALMIVPYILFAVIWGMGGTTGIGWAWLWYTLILLLAHEGTHAIAWKLASGLPWSVFSFGIQWKTVTPYCHSREPMPARAYRIGAVMPLLFTGLVPWIVSLITGDAGLAIASSLLISGAGGDIYILWSIRDLPDYVLLQDHDSRAGCIALWPVK